MFRDTGGTAIWRRGVSANVIYGYHGYANAQGDEYLIALAKINIESTSLKIILQPFN